MEDPWVVDYLTEKVIGQLKAGGFGYLKVDYNETMGLGVDGGHSLGGRPPAEGGGLPAVLPENPGGDSRHCH